ncbi:MAG: reverse transcriptase domain-containing protein [Aeromonas sp.]
MDFKKSNLSLFNYFLIYGKAYKRGYDSLISKVPTPKQRNASIHAYEQQQSKVYQFTFTPTGTDIPLTQSITSLKSIDDPMLLCWLDEFKELVSLCSWSDTQAMQILKAVVDRSLWPLLSGKKSFVTYIEAIINAKYPITKRFTYEQMLHRIKQNDYYSIEEYVSAIDDTFTKYTLCAKINKEEQHRRKEEYIYKGLASTTTIEMERLGIYDPNEIIQKIKSIEIKLLEQQEHKQKINFENNKDSQTLSNNNKTGTEKYCHYHKSTYHDAKECKNLKRKNITKTTSALTIKEPMSTISSLLLNIKINDQRISGILDTGAVWNFISINQLEQLNMLKDLKEANGNVQFADGSLGDIVGEVCIKFTIQEFPLTNYEAMFKVIRSKLELLILGSPFLKNNNAKIDYDSMKIALNEHVFYLEPEYNEKWENTPDAVISRNVFVASECSDPIKNKILRRIAEYQRNNPAQGTIPNEEMIITLTSNIPIQSYPYPCPFKLQKLVDEEIERLINNGVIKKSTSRYSSPAFPLLKKNGRLRLVVDYRKINAITVRETFPFPSVFDEIRSIPKSNVFSQIDLSNGYHQLKLSPCSQKYTAFLTNKGIFEYTRVPFGLTNAPRVFQRIMHKLLGHLIFLRIFLDDVLIFSDSFEEHEKHVNQVLDILNKNNISIGFEKSNFCCQSVKYLGLILSHEGFKPDISRVQEFKQLPPPKTMRQLQKILGFLNWFRPFIPNLSTILVPITDKTQKNSHKFEWTLQDKKIIDSVYEKIENATILSYPNFNEPFYLDVDASEKGIGSILYQDKKLIGIFSKKFTPIQLNYTIPEKEFYAIFMSLEYFKKIIFCSRVIINTDHLNLINNCSIQSSRVNRWKLIMEEYNIELKYKKGTNNIAADVLSRVLIIKEADNYQEEIIKLIFTGQKEANFRQYLQKVPYTEVVISNLSIYVTKKSGKILIPDKIAENLIIRLHKKLEHPGICTLYKTASKYFKIKNFKPLIQKISENCHICQCYKHTKHKYGKLIGFLSTEKPFKDISMDIYGPIPGKIFSNHSTNNGLYLLSITDRCSRWTEVFSLTTIKTANVIKCLKLWFSRNGMPKTILSDNGRQFISKNMKQFLCNNNIKAILTTPFNPTGNSLSERINQKITDVIRKNKNISVKEITLKVNYALQNCYNRSIGYSPHEIINKFSSIDPLQRRLPIKLNQIYNYVKKGSLRENEKINTKRNVNFKFSIGDKVYKRNEIRYSKYEELWEGPFEIVEIDINENVFILKKDSKCIKSNLKQIRPVEGKKMSYNSTYIGTTIKSDENNNTEKNEVKRIELLRAKFPAQKYK